MKARIWTAVFLLMAGLGYGQEFELGKVTKAELAEAAHPLEPDAPAAVLFESGRTYMDYSDVQGFTLVTDVEIRIKIYKKEGYDWANKTVKYYIGQKPTEQINFSKAVTYNLVNGNIEKTKLKSEGEFDEKINKFWAAKKITMPNVKEGSVIEYRYTLYSPFLGNVSDWQFQSSIPVNHSKYVTKFPEYFMFKTNFKGFLMPTITTTSDTRTHNFTTKERGENVSTSFDTNKMSFNEAVTTYTANKMPSMKDEDFVSNINNYVSTVEHELTAIQYPNSPIKSLSTTWEDLAKTIYDSESFGAELKKTGYFEEDLKTITSGMVSNDEKAAAIFNFVKSRMNWNGYYDYTCTDGVKKAYKDKVGNAAEINLMLTAMLRSAGISANPVLVSTRDNGIAFFPNRSAYNYVVCAIEKNESIVLLDATDKYALPNILPVRALNWFGRIIREYGSSAVVDLMPTYASKDVVKMIASIDSQGKLTGKLRDEYFDYNAFLYRSRYAGFSKDSYLEKLEKRFSGLEIADDYAVSSDDFSKPVVESYSFTHNGISEIIGDKIYFFPMVFFAQHENPFKQDKREYPVDFVFPNQDKYSITINLPEGYAVESIPAPTMVTLGNAGKFSYNITSNGKQVQLVSSIDINEAVISPDDYGALRDFFKAMIDKQNERVVLKKL